ncbi:MAG TPA: GNAT family N-acetyltransferase [Flavobacterium sp.]|nr:GNAT family N-acetyltransferase [Flavobacterium sp.]
MIQIKKISADETIDLRHEVLRSGMPKEESVFEGDYDEDTLHLGAFDKEKLVGVITFHHKKTNTFKAHPIYRLTGLAVLEEYRGKGIGKKLIEKGIDKVSKHESVFLWCFARDFAVHFYEKLGFLLKIQQVIIPNIGSHRIMFKFVPKED